MTSFQKYRCHHDEFWVVLYIFFNENGACNKNDILSLKYAPLLITDMIHVYVYTSFKLSSYKIVSEGW